MAQARRHRRQGGAGRRGGVRAEEARRHVGPRARRARDGRGRALASARGAVPASTTATGFATPLNQPTVVKIRPFARSPPNSERRSDAPNSTSSTTWAHNGSWPVTVALQPASRATMLPVAIINDRPSPFGYPPYKDLDLYYTNCVIGGPGAFIVVADGFASAGQ